MYEIQADRNLFTIGDSVVVKTNNKAFSMYNGKIGVVKEAHAIAKFEVLESGRLSLGDTEWNYYVDMNETDTVPFYECEIRAIDKVIKS